MNEDFTLVGGTRRVTHREDSAYMSQRDSLSGPPETTSTGTQGEEDQNEYVLPGFGESPEKGEDKQIRAACVCVTFMKRFLQNFDALNFGWFCEAIMKYPQKPISAFRVKLILDNV